MPRRGTITRREVLPDPVYNSKLVTQVINKVLLDGKKSTAEQIVYGALEMVRQKTGRDPVEVLQEAIQALTPHLEVRSRRVGGATYQVPMEVKPERRTALAIRWMITYARTRAEKTMRDRLAGEIMAAIKNEGGAVKKKEDTHKMAEANKAFAHYRF